MVLVLVVLVVVMLLLLRRKNRGQHPGVQPSRRRASPKPPSLSHNLDGRKKMHQLAVFISPCPSEPIHAFAFIHTSTHRSDGTSPSGSGFLQAAHQSVTSVLQ